MSRLRVLVAPNAFKHGPDAFKVAAAIASGLKKSRLNPEISTQPIADGGDGTLQVLAEKFAAELRTHRVQDPLGRPIEAVYGYSPASSTAIIELANASGLKLLKKEERDVLHANTYGTGQLIGHAVEAGARSILLSVGGSATVDGGTGILSALGFEFRDASNRLLRPCGGNLHLIAKIIAASLPDVGLLVLVDVRNPLIGKWGAAEVFGPQKGATPKQVRLLEQGLTNWANLILRETGENISESEGGGAAGGVAAGLAGFLKAEVRPGAAYIFRELGLEAMVRQADCILTAEGSLDEQTAAGKAPFALLELAKRWHKPVIGLAGKVPRELPQGPLSQFDALFAIGSGPEDLDTAISHTLINLERTSLNIGNLLASSKGLAAVF